MRGSKPGLAFVACSTACTIWSSIPLTWAALKRRVMPKRMVKRPNGKPATSVLTLMPAR